MDVVDCFADTYAEAREKFLAAAREAGAEIESFPHPLTGPSGEALATDVALLGNPGAKKLLITGSATHGVEGFCGSGAQVALMRSGIADRLGDDVALLQIHAQNPHGFAHERRVTEDNVDYNRNFVDFDAPLPENPGYAELHPHLVPSDWDGPARAAADAGLKAFIDAHGAWRFQEALSFGQYEHADGLYFGGREPSWSRRTVTGIMARWAGHCSDVGVIDFHTGLGPRGFGELIVTGTADSENYARARDWYGADAKSPEAGDSVSAIVNGALDEGYIKGLPDARVTFIAIEYGTLPPIEVLAALRADNWLYVHGDPASEQGKAIKRQIRAAFYGEEPQWKADIWQRAEEIVGKALTGLGGPGRS